MDFRILASIYFSFQESAIVIGTQDKDNLKHHILNCEVKPFITAQSVVDLFARSRLPETISQRVLIVSNLDIEKDLTNQFQENPPRRNFSFEFFTRDSEVSETQFLQLLYAFSCERLTVEGTQIKTKVDRRLRSFDINSPDQLITTIALLREVGSPAMGAMKLV